MLNSQRKVKEGRAKNTTRHGGSAYLINDSINTKKDHRIARARIVSSSQYHTFNFFFFSTIAPLRSTVYYLKIEWQ